MIALVSAGLVYGLSAGFSPGPLLALVISQTLKHGMREGVKVALAPLITDLPIILVSLLVLTRLTDFKTVLGVISIIGGVFVAYLAYGNFRAPRLKEEAGPGRSPVIGQRGRRQCPESPSLSVLADSGRAGYRPGMVGKSGGFPGFFTGLLYLPGGRQDSDGLDHRQVQTMA